MKSQKKTIKQVDVEIDTRVESVQRFRKNADKHLKVVKAISFKEFWTKQLEVNKLFK